MKFRLGSYRPGESGLKKALGDLEADIMERVWQEDEVKVRDIYESIAKDRDIAYTTVMTVMGRLSDKGILSKEREGKHYVYTPAISREEFNKAMVSSFVTGIKDDLGANALAFFVDSLAENDETLSELEKLIQEKRNKQE
jgi:predicted transcriptional regulator